MKILNGTRSIQLLVLFVLFRQPSFDNLIFVRRYANRHVFKREEYKERKQRSEREKTLKWPRTAVRTVWVRGCNATGEGRGGEGKTKTTMKIKCSCLRLCLTVAFIKNINGTNVDIRNPIDDWNFTWRISIARCSYQPPAPLHSCSCTAKSSSGGFPAIPQNPV